MLIAASTHKVTIAGHQIFYRCLGSGSPLVLLHGFGVSGHLWLRCLPYLAQERQVLVVDLPGHGQSKLAGRWRLRAVAPLLAAWLRQMHLPPVALMGHSMGGAIAIHLAAHAPDLFERLVLVNAAGTPLQAQLPALMMRSLRSMLQPGSGGYPLELLQDTLLKPRPRLLWESAQEMLRSDFRQELARIDLPTLILWGERDLLLPLQMGHALREALPHATFITMPQSGHRPPLSQPGEFSRIVLDFLGRG